VQRGEAPLRILSSPFPKGGPRGIGLREEAEIGHGWIPAFAGMTVIAHTAMGYFPYLWAASTIHFSRTGSTAEIGRAHV